LARSGALLMFAVYVISYFTFNKETEQGARIRISTSNPEALQAVYDFLRFQIKEHKTGDSLDVGQ
jgi:D-Tyr-tRNAtyr deacylase